MKLVAGTFVLVVAVVAVLVPTAAGGTTLLSDNQLSRSATVQEPTARYIKTYGLAPSPEALAATAPDLIERYVGSRPSTSTEPTARYIKTYGLAPSPEALAMRTTTTDDGFDWGGATFVGGGVLFLALLLATGATVALRHSRDNYASV